LQNLEFNVPIRHKVSQSATRRTIKSTLAVVVFLHAQLITMSFLCDNSFVIFKPKSDKQTTDRQGEHQMIAFKVTSRDIPLSDSMYAAVEKHIDHLERFSDRILHCEVILSRPHSHHQRKTRYHHVRIQLKLHKGAIIIDREPEKNIKHTAFRTALQHAFKLATRQLEGEFKKLRSLSKVRRNREFAQASGED
jgi:ribosome-associated translation inhibitor RaiA